MADESADDAADNPPAPDAEPAVPLPVESASEAPADLISDATGGTDPIAEETADDDRVSVIEAHERESRRLLAEGDFEAAAAVERLTMFFAEMRAHVLANDHLHGRSSLLDAAAHALR